MDLNLADSFQELNTVELESVEGGSWTRVMSLKSSIFDNLSTIIAETTPPNVPNDERINESARMIAGAVTEMRGLFRENMNFRSRHW